MTVKTSLVVCLLVVLTGCQAVSYQPVGFRGGYSERLLEDGRYRVSYSGNGSVTLEKAIDFAMLRSAVLAKQNGADYFETTEHTAKVSRVDLGMPGVYADKPSVVVKIKPLNTAKEATGRVNLKQCAMFNVIFRMLQYSDKSPQYTHSAANCIEEIKTKYQLKDTQIFLD